MNDIQRRALAAKSTFRPLPAKCVKQFVVIPQSMSVADYNAKIAQPTFSSGLTCLTAAEKARAAELIMEREAETTATKAASAKGTKVKDNQTTAIVAPVAPYIPKPTPSLQAAHSFITACKAHVFGVSTITTRDETIKAIESFVGFDAARELGSQESEARSLANRIISGEKLGGLTIKEKRSANASLTGFVGGMPDALERKVNHLLGRELFLVDSILTAQWEAKREERSADERQAFMKEALASAKELTGVRKELSEIARIL